MAAAAAAADAPRESYTLRSLEEFRFEVEAQATATITLTSGSAEIFGAEMVTNKAYSFSGTQQAVFSWEGCTLEVEGSAGHCYVAAETPMTSYLQLQGELQSMRDLAESSGGQGPCVLVAGPADTGKSSLSRLLANYLARSGHSGTLVDLDFVQGELVVPGCIAASPVCRPLDIERGTESLSPLAFWLGHTAAAPHVTLLRLLSTTLAAAVHARHEAAADERAGGCIINTCGWVDGAGYELLLHQAAVFRASVLVVIGDDRLHSQLTAHAASSSMMPKPMVVKLSKSGGVLTRSDAARRASMRGRISEYFYGAQRELFPHSTVLDFSNVQVFTIGVAAQAAASALPIGMKLPENQMASSQLAPSSYPSLTHSLLAFVYADSHSCDDLLRASAAGYVWVSAVDLAAQKITLLAPTAFTSMPIRLLGGTIKWSQAG